MVTASKDNTTARFRGVIANPAGRLAARFGGGLVLWLRAVRTRHELLRLSERALADIGASPGGVGAFARQSDPWRRLPKDEVLGLALDALFERVESWRARRRRQLQVYRELMAYSDAELTDLGISRRDIGAIARGDGRPAPA